MHQAAIFIALIPTSSAFLLDLLGGGGGCCRPTCCPPPPPEPVCPAPMPCPPLRPCPPPPPSCCGSCGCRKKRDTVVTIRHTLKRSRCTSEVLRNKLLKSISGSVESSITALQKSTEDEMDFVVICDKKSITFFARVEDFCQVEKRGIYCALFQLDTLVP